MGYSEDPAMVRVDFFKPSGKWYTTEAAKWTGKYRKDPDKDATEDDGWDILKQFAKSLRDHLNKDGKQRMTEMTAVCIHPYHENEYPIILKDGIWNCYKD